MSHVRASLKRKMSRIHKRQETFSTKKLERHTSPFFEYDAALRIGGAGKFHEQIGEVTGLEPKIARLAGQPRRPGSTFLAKEDIWVLASPLDETLPLEDHVDWLLQALAPHAGFLKEVIAQAAWADLCLGCLSEVPYPMIRAGKSSTELIKLLDLELMFNFTCV
ncbi:DUF4279 domain-containing protein [Massilia rubra]|uniref:DUF4279 domain-containing protein n=1 Tax=Massilia rubra TaxID=2607910 RepID=A0ABX0LK88_9BURK|nr:DUF4279 domain-containing protein [Massilia rubra]NHZ33078.1 DUF4279 domain-containing protein [Massilia rubra]